MAATVLKVNKELHIEAPPFAAWVDQLALTAGVAASFTFPANVDLVLITVTAGALWARSDGGTAVVPAAGITDGTGSEGIVNGSVRQVRPGQVVSFINGTDCVVSFSELKTFITG